jgi:hypothetical protein
MKKIWFIIWLFLSFIGESIFIYLNNSDIIPLSVVGQIIGFVLVPVIMGIITIGIKILIEAVTR